MLARSFLDMVAPMIAQARKIEEALTAAGVALADEEVEGRSEDGKVKVRLSGVFELKHLRITPGALEGATPRQLERAVAAAFTDALAQARALAAGRAAAALDPEAN